MFDKSIQIDPDYSKAYSNRAWCLTLAGRYEEALESAENATLLEPAYARGWSNRGDALFALDRYADAVLSYETALILDPWLKDAQEGMENSIKMM